MEDITKQFSERGNRAADFRRYMKKIIIKIIAILVICTNAYAMVCLAPSSCINDKDNDLLSINFDVSDFFDDSGNVVEYAGLDKKNERIGYHYTLRELAIGIFRSGLFQKVYIMTLHGNITMVGSALKDEYVIAFKVPADYFDYSGICALTYVAKAKVKPPGDMPSKYYEKFMEAREDGKLGHLPPDLIDWDETIRATTIFRIISMGGPVKREDDWITGKIIKKWTPEEMRRVFLQVRAEIAEMKRCSDNIAKNNTDTEQCL